MLTSQLIHLSNQDIVCLPWRRGRPLAEHRFSTSAEGLAAFGEYLRDWQFVPVRIAVDLIEEDFRIETIPHLRAGDRKVVIRRRLAQLYRGTPFRMAAVQGREASGRRDDILLCTAITQSEGLTACLDVLARWRIPILGVYPAAILGEQLLKQMRVEAEQLLLITLLSEGAVRISFFQKGRLKFSRISQADPGSGVSLAAGIRDEARKTMQYVASQAWYLRSMAVRTVLLADQDDAAELIPAWADSDPPLQLVAPVALARTLRMPRPPAHSSATGVLLHLLMLHPPAEQLAPRERMRDGMLWYVRATLFAASGLIAAVALVLAAVDVLNALNVREETEQLRQALATRLLDVARMQRQMPASAVPPDRMSAVVRFHRNEVLGAPRPLAFLQSLSLALDAAPDLRLLRVHWVTSTQRPPANAALGADAPARLPGPGSNPILSGLQPREFYQDIRIEGEVDAGNVDPGSAIRSVEALAERLRAPQRQIQVLRAPYDLDPAHGLAAGAMHPLGSGASFVVRVLAKGPAP
jgi:hypothetical protein